MRQWRNPEADADGCGELPAAGHQSEIFVQPTPLADAIGFVDALAAVPGSEMPALGREWPIVRQLCMEKRLSANDIPDAWLAATIIQLGEHLVTFDTDFRKLLKRTQVTVLGPRD